MASFNPGDVFVDNITIVSPRTPSWNMAQNFLSASILETIFTPGVMGEIEVIDTEDFLGKLKLAGDELVQFQFTKPNGISASYMFHLNSIKDVTIVGSMKTKTYKLEVVSREVLTGQAKYVQKGYNDTIDNIVKDLQGQLNSKLSLISEATKGKRNIKIANQQIYHAIEMLRKQAVSNDSKSSNYMFWQTWKSFYFQTLEYMVKQGPIKTFKQENTVGHSMNSDVDTNILAWQVKQNMDAINRIHAGVLKQRVATFNVHTNSFAKQDFKPELNEFTNAGNGPLNTSAFRSLFESENSGRSVFKYNNLNEKLDVGKSYVPAAIPYKMLNLAQMQEQLLHMTVIGDPVLEAGKTINNNIPKITSDVNNTEPEPQASGKWLIAKVEHQIRGPDVRPRYVCNLECLKGVYEESVE